MRPDFVELSAVCVFTDGKTVRKPCNLFIPYTGTFKKTLWAITFTHHTNLSCPKIGFGESTFLTPFTLHFVWLFACQ